MTTEQYVTLAEVRDLLEAENTKRELLPTQKNALDHGLAVAPLSLEDTKSIQEEVSKLEGVTESTATKIADMLPRYPEEVRAIFSKERVNLEPETITSIIDTVSRYL